MKKEIRDIRMVFGVFCVFFALLAWKFYPSIVGYAFIVLIGVTGVLIGFSPMSLRPLFKLWLRFAHVLGRINTRIILFLVFTVVTVPAGLIMRLLGKDPMKRKMEEVNSYWEPVEFEGIRKKNQYERQF
ncbi:MAG: hypothetical protein JSW39_11275 [Desulfobacterales bacterium]|nr:MAG: hypothetical protein JSW39_11275 [Desulfobacterales bacterium]